ncbi:hypothetical protein BS50DRAFT_568668 [Corynespora cassiicola Philippines]|uniref:Peroxin 20 n=1 Tax=Corynespora cassiicola Philippines TaxID=1448308 RepID=A0A2T2P6Y2_CORCC|nr:hypothetical protein BS50DRAFT_568668 [Corynespora cassiicola Philippines]
MADALCGPSNALQNFQKHSSVDRTLQQDRLTSRHTPAQGFRSSLGPNAGALDPEFDAFQAGHAGPPQPDFHLPPHLSHAPPPPQFAQAPQAPDWASDFQRLNISSPQAPPLQQHRPPQVTNAAASWHQDFMRQQSPAAQTPTYQQNTFGGMKGFGMGAYGGSSFQQRPAFGVMNGAPASDVAQGKQRAQDVPAFDEAAFEQAFAQAQQDMLDEASVQQQESIEEQQNHERQQEALRRIQGARQTEPEADPVLARIRETRPSVYAALKMRSEIDLGQISTAETFLSDLQSLESTGELTQDASEAKWVVDALKKLADRPAPDEFKTRTERLITAINQRLMSSYPLLSSRAPINQDHIWEELEAAGYVRTPVSERVEQQPQPQQKEEQPLRNDDDEMAETAGRLLERVADNTSEKFQNSQFLELMRRLRDREVRVEGDKMVETGSQPSTSTPTSAATAVPASAVPGVDPKILDHAAVDFEVPVYSERECQISSGTIAFTPPITDRIPLHEQDLDLGRNGVEGLEALNVPSA